MIDFLCVLFLLAVIHVTLASPATAGDGAEGES